MDKKANISNIRPAGKDDITECVRVIRESFMTVAEKFGFTEENAGRFTAFATTEERLRYHMAVEKRPMYVYIDSGRIAGYYSLFPTADENTGEKACELNNLCVLPEYRHSGIGENLLLDAFDKAKAMGCGKMKISIVEENQVLKKWYERFGFDETETRKFDFFPFTCGYMERKL